MVQCKVSLSSYCPLGIVSYADRGRCALKFNGICIQHGAVMEMLSGRISQNFPNFTEPACSRCAIDATGYRSMTVNNREAVADSGAESGNVVSCSRTDPCSC